MPRVAEEAHLHLYEKLQQQLGDEHAVTLMTMLPATDFDELATKADLQALEARLRSELHEVLYRQTKTYVAWMLSQTLALAGVMTTGLAIAGS